MSQVISEAAKAAGITLSFADYTGLSRLYGDYVRGRSSREVLADAQAQLGRTGIDSGIDSRMVWTPPYGPSVTAAGPSPWLLVKVEYTRETPLGPVTGVFSHLYHQSELHTVGGVLADVQAQMDASVGDTDLQGAEATGLLSIERVHP